MKAKSDEVLHYEEAISHSGLRYTPQRRRVFDVLLEQRDHPTATEVFMRAKKRMPSISLATVYNCLETLVECGLVRQVNIDREPTRYCPNLRKHGHFICSKCSGVTDIDLDSESVKKMLQGLPTSYTVDSVEINLRGTCTQCHQKNN